MMRSIQTSKREQVPSDLRFAAGAQMPRPELPRILALRAEQALKQMREIETAMKNPELSVEKLERYQARMVRWAEHVQWFAGGALENQVQELKSMLLSLGSGPVSGNGGAELAVWALAGSFEGAQLGARLLSRSDKSLRELARVGLLSTRNAGIIEKALESFHREQPVQEAALDAARNNGSPLLGLATIAEITGTRDFESLEIPGPAVMSAREHLARLQEMVTDSNPLVRAAVVRAIGYAVFGSKEYGALPDLRDWFRKVMLQDKDLRVRYRAVAAIPAFDLSLRGELIEAALSAGLPELRVPALRCAAGVKYAPLNEAMLKQFRKLMEADGAVRIPELQTLVADSLRGNIPAAMEGELLGVVLASAADSRRKSLALRAIGAPPDLLQEELVRLVNSSEADELSAAASASLQLGCSVDTQEDLVEIICGAGNPPLPRLAALRALPVNCAEAVQRQLITVLATEDDPGFLSEVVEAFGRFKENFVRDEIREIVMNSAARENGRASAITILGSGPSELPILRGQLKEGNFHCRLASAEVLCNAGLNGIDGRNAMSLLIQTLKESATGQGPIELERLGKACNNFLRATGLL